MLKKFIKYYRPYRVVFWIDIFCAFLVSVIDLSFPQILNFLTSGVYTEGPAAILRALPLVGVTVLTMYLVRFAGRYYISYQGHVMGARMESDMRQDLFEHYQRLSFSYYDRNNTGEMMSKLISDLFDISELAHHGPENIFISLVKIIGSFSLLMMVSVPMTLILASVTAIMAVFCFFQNKKMRTVFTDNRKRIAGVNARLQDSLSGIRVVKSFANEALETKKFKKSNLLFLTSKESSYRRMAAYHSGNNFFQGVLFTTVLVAGGFFVANGGMRVTDLALYALYINIFINPIDVLIEFTELFQKGYSGFRRFIEVVETDPEIRNSPGARELANVRGRIDLNRVSFSYDRDEPVLKEIDLHIKAGKTVALVGPSGGGKTTICSLLPRFYDVTAGSVCVDGQDVRTLTLESLRAAIGIVQQDVYLFAGTIGENIAYGRPGASQEEIEAAAERAHIHDFIMGLESGYDTYVGERGARLSGGQKQRISIARVFLKNPPILILDEATSALDNESERHIQHSLEELAKNRTTIVIAHRLSTIRNADEIIVMSGDGIVERGTHGDLLQAKGLYSRYYNMQFEGLRE